MSPTTKVTHDDRPGHWCRTWIVWSSMGPILDFLGQILNMLVFFTNPKFITWMVQKALQLIEPLGTNQDAMRWAKSTLFLFYLFSGRSVWVECIHLSMTRKLFDMALEPVMIWIESCTFRDYLRDHYTWFLEVAKQYQPGWL